MTTTPTDPPPAVERERPARSRSSHSGQAHTGVSKGIVWVVGILLAALALVRLPNVGFFLGLKAFALEAAAVLLAVFVVSRGEWTWARARAALISGPNLFILGFLLWVGASAALSPLPQLSRYEAMRHLGGGLLYFAIAYGLTSRRHLGQMVWLLSLMGTVAALVAFKGYGETKTLADLAGAFRNAQLLSAFLCLIFPLTLVGACADEVGWRRIATQVALIAVAAGILIARNRSVWAGSVIAVVLVAGLHLWYARRPGGFQLHRSQLIIPLVMVVLSVGLFLAMSRSGTMLQARTGTIGELSKDSSFQWRLGMWDKARRMIRDRPLTGWGVGLFPVEQTRYFHPAVVPSLPAYWIVQHGPSMSENAHNTYVQLAAELGIPGIALYLGIFAAFFVTALRALPKLGTGFRQTVVIGSIAAVASQIVSGIGSPAWEFPECSLMLWLVLGLGMAAAGLGSRGAPSERG